MKKNTIAIFLLFFIFSFKAYSDNKSTNNTSYYDETRVDPWEYKILKQNCSLIVANVRERYAGMGAINSSGFTQDVKANITNYLFSVRTDAAKKLYQECEKLKWDVDKICRLFYS